jgi:hypothetical protein
LGAVKKLSKAILITLSVMLTLGIIAVVGANLYVQSAGVQARLQEEMSKALRMPLTVTNTSLTPWSGLRITGITIPHAGTNLLEAASFRARYRLWPLLSKRLVIYEMNVDQPKVVWQQNAEGKWVLPTARAAEEKSASAQTPARQEKKKSDFQVTVEGFQIQRGSMELLDQNQKSIATFTDVHVDFDRLEEKHMTGTATIGRAVWAGNLVLDQVRTSFSYVDGALSLPDFAANAGGGPVTGTLAVEFGKPKSPFVNTLAVERVDIARLTTEAGWPAGQAAGILSGTLDLKGTWDEFARAEGRAKLSLREGKFREMPMLEMIGQGLQIRELVEGKFEDSHAEIRIADEKAFIESLTMKADRLQLSANGLVRVDGKLQLATRLTAENELLDRLPGFIARKFTAGNGGRYIDFNITGKTNKPKTDLIDKIMGQQIEAQLNDFISGLFPTTQKKDEPKKAGEDKKKKKDSSGADAGGKPPSTPPAAQ